MVSQGELWIRGQRLSKPCAVGLCPPCAVGLPPPDLRRAGPGSSRAQLEAADAQGLPCRQLESAAEESAGPRLHQLIRWLVDMRTSLLAALARLFGLPVDDGSEPEEAEDEQRHLLPGIVAIVVLVIGIIILKRPVLV